MKRFVTMLMLLALLTGCTIKNPPDPPPEKSTLLTPYIEASSETYLNRFCGLMTIDGEIITEADCDIISLAEYSDDNLHINTLLPVWVLYRQSPQERLENRYSVALYAEDGSWHTDFVYHGCAGTPYGLFVGNDSGCFLLDPEDGSERKAWTWDELRHDPAGFPWVTGDAYETAEWTGEKLFLGGHGETLMLDVETGEVESISYETWCAIQDKRIAQPPVWTALLDGRTVTVTHTEPGGTTETQFDLSFDARYCFVETMDGTPRVCVTNDASDFCAVYTPEGDAVIPEQNGRLCLGSVENQNMSCIPIQYPQESVVKVYDWDGNLKHTLPAAADCRVTQRGYLVEITDFQTYAAYYDPETGEKMTEHTF